MHPRSKFPDSLRHSLHLLPDLRKNSTIPGQNRRDRRVEGCLRNQDPVQKGLQYPQAGGSTVPNSLLPDQGKILYEKRRAIFPKIHQNMFYLLKFKHSRKVVELNISVETGEGRKKSSRKNAFFIKSRRKMRNRSRRTMGTDDYWIRVPAASHS